MRREFKPIIFEEMSLNKDIWFISIDLGYKFTDKIQEYFPNRFIQCRASEQQAMGCAVGLALDGKIPIIYSITSFLLFTPASWIRNYLGNENIKVKLLAGGRLNDYHEDGFSHYCGDDLKFLEQFPNIKTFIPENVQSLKEYTHNWLYCDSPAYLNLKR